MPESLRRCSGVRGSSAMVLPGPKSLPGYFTALDGAQARGAALKPRIGARRCPLHQDREVVGLDIAHLDQPVAPAFLADIHQIDGAAHELLHVAGIVRSECDADRAADADRAVGGSHRNL